VALLTNTKVRKNMLVAPFDVCPVFSYFKEKGTSFNRQEFLFRFVTRTAMGCGLMLTMGLRMNIMRSSTVRRIEHATF
jgi:hypothetical protein